MKSSSRVLAAAYVWAAACGTGAVMAESVTLQFNAEGVKPDAELRQLDPSSKVERNQYKEGHDAVGGGVWKLNPNDQAEDSGALFYGGIVPKLATKAPHAPLSINVRMRMLKNLSSPGGTGSSELCFTIRGPDGRLVLYFDFDAKAKRSRIGGKHANGSVFFRELPEGMSLGDWHNLAITWDAADNSPFPARLHVDGEDIGPTYVFTEVGTGEVYVEFGDGDSGAPGKNPVIEVDWVRFATDATVVQTKPATAAVKR